MTIDWLTETHKSINAKITELRDNHKGHYLVSTPRFIRPRDYAFDGNSDELEKIAAEWKAKGGEAIIAYKVSDFSKAKLTLLEKYDGAEHRIAKTETAAEKEAENLTGLSGIIFTTRIM